METKKFTSGNEVVDKIELLPIHGNVIPHEWFNNITNKDNGKERADLISIVILAEIIYWYRPIVEVSPQGNAVRRRPKFHSDKLQKSHGELAHKFGLSKFQVSSAVKRLKEKGLLETETRNVPITTRDGRKIMLGNVLYITPVYEEILKVTGGSDPLCNPLDNPSAVDYPRSMDYTRVGQSTDIGHVSGASSNTGISNKELNTNTNTPLTPHGGNDAKTDPSPSRSDVDVEDLDNHVVTPPPSSLDNPVVTPPPSKETTVFSEASDSLQSPALPGICSSVPPSYANGFDPPCVDGDDEGVHTPPESSSDDLFSVPSPDEDPTPSSASPPPRKSANDKMVVDDPVACRIASWFGHRPGYKWRRKEYLAFEDAVPGTSDSDLRMLEKFYSFRGVYNGSPTYARREMYTLFNHWQGEINKAREFLSTHGMLAEFVEEREEMSAFEKFNFQSTPPLRDFRDNEPDEALDAMFKGVLASFKEDFPKEACIAQ